MFPDEVLGFKVIGEFICRDLLKLMQTTAQVISSTNYFTFFSNLLFNAIIFIFIIYEFQNLAIETFQGVELFHEYNLSLREFIL